MLGYCFMRSHCYIKFRFFFSGRWLASHWYLLFSLSISFPKYFSFTEPVLYVIFLQLSFFPWGRRIFPSLLPLSLPYYAHWPIKLEEFTTTNPLRTVTNSENVLQCPANTIYIFSGSYCLQGKIKQREVFSCFSLWITLNLFMQGKLKHCRIEAKFEKKKKPAPSDTKVFLNKVERRELGLMWENSTNSSEIGWEGKKRQTNGKNYRLLIERNKEERITLSKYVYLVHLLVSKTKTNKRTDKMPCLRNWSCANKINAFFFTDFNVSRARL